MVVSKPDYAKSGTYWSWSNPPESEPYSNVLSDEASVRFSPLLRYLLLLLVADFSSLVCSLVELLFLTVGLPQVGWCFSGAKRSVL